MKILDLNSLDNKNLKRFNKISVEIKDDYNDFISDLINKTNLNLGWLLSSLISRNPYLSDVFEDICYFLLIFENINGNYPPEKIITKNKIQKIILKKYLKNNNLCIYVSSKKEFIRKKGLIYRYYSIFRIFKIAAKYLLSQNKSRKELLKKSSNPIILDTFILENSLNSGIYNDRYYNGLLDNVSSIEREKLFFVPTILAPFKTKQLHKIWVNSKENIIYKHDFLKLNDYIGCFKQLAEMKFKKNSSFYFKGINLKPLIIDEYKNRRYQISSFEGLLNYNFIKQLKSSDIDFKIFIDWHENQPIDKGMIKGIKTYFPNATVKGYQGYVISKDYNIYNIPTDFEIQSNTFPDTICVIGDKFLSDSISKKINQEVVPAFRFNGLYNSFKNDFSNNESDKYVLIVLPINLHDSINILQNMHKTLKKINKEYNLKINIKPHPALNFEKVIKSLKNEWITEAKIVTGDFNKFLIEADIVVGSASSTMLESIARGVPVIVIGNNSGLTQNPIPKNISNFIWEICFSPLEIVDSLHKFFSYKKDDRIKLKEYSDQIKKDYFSPLSKKGVKKLLSER